MLALVTALVLSTFPLAAPPPGACSNPTPARPAITEQPWAQQTLAPKAVWEHSKGSGVLVAVVDSGVDADHPQLAGKVLPGEDFHLVGNLPGNFDCVSHGTAAASIIAAEPAKGVGFAGLAPQARILPVRITDRDGTGSDISDRGPSTGVDPVVLARGIWYAAEQGAKVINLSLAGAADNPFVRDAVAHAVAKDILVVAAVGNHQRGDDPGPATFPAGYDGVLGVGAVDNSGTRLPDSQIGPQVDLVAPGGGITAAARAGGHDVVSGTSFAAPFVSATAALVRAAWPHLTAREVAARILATATPMPGGAGSPAYGAGMVNPYRAVTEGLATAKPVAQPEVTVPPTDPAQTRIAAWWSTAASETRLAAGAAAAFAVLASLTALVIARGRRTRWQARLTPPPPTPPPTDDLPDEVFLLR